MRKLGPTDRQWLIERYGREISPEEYAGLVRYAYEENVKGGNGVTVTSSLLRDGSILTRHEGTWETFYYVNA